MTHTVQNVTTTTILAVATAGIITALGVYWYQRKRKYSIPTNWEPVGKVKSLYIYPLKSGHRTELETALCTEYGVKMTQSGSLYQFCDRNLVIYKEENNEFQTARQYPKLIFIKTAPCDADNFIMNAPGMPTLKARIPSAKENNKAGEITLHKGEKIFTIDCGDEAAKWISDYVLGASSGLRIGFHNGLQRRNINKTHQKYLKEYSYLRNAATGMYTDLSSFLLVNQASVDELNSRIPDANITALNFRPNILIEGENAVPYAEDNWKWIKIGDVILYMAKPCTRCILTTIDPETGVKSGTNEPLRTMRKYRQLKDVKNIELDGNLTVMGVNMGLLTPGEIAVGDVVYIGNN